MSGSDINEALKKALTDAHQTIDRLAERCLNNHSEISDLRTRNDQLVEELGSICCSTCQRRLVLVARGGRHKPGCEEEQST